MKKEDTSIAAIGKQVTSPDSVIDFGDGNFAIVEPQEATQRNGTLDGARRRRRVLLVVTSLAAGIIAASGDAKAQYRGAIPGWRPPMALPAPAFRPRLPALAFRPMLPAPMPQYRAPIWMPRPAPFIGSRIAEEFAIRGGVVPPRGGSIGYGNYLLWMIRPWPAR